VSLLQEHSKLGDVHGPSPLNYAGNNVSSQGNSHDLYARSSVAVALWKAMVESKCRTRAIDDRNAQGAKSTRDLTPLYRWGDAWDQDSSIRSTLRVLLMDSLWMFSIMNNFSELKQGDVRSKYI